MRFWRICRRRFAADAATGEGARLFGGRWNSRGVRVVYASASLSLAAIETFVHLEPNLAPPDLVFIEGEIPERIATPALDLKSLPAHWERSQGESLHRFGDEWIQAGRSAALLVPSAIIPGEWNLLLNPAHPEFPRILFHDPVPFRFDARMFRSRPL